MVRLVILRVLESYFRHRWLYLVPIVLMIAAAVVYAVRQEQKYIAGGVLYVQAESFLASLTSVRDSSISWWVTPAQQTANEISELMQTAAFMRAIIQVTDLEANMTGGSRAVGETITEAREAIWVTTLGDNQVIINSAHVDPLIAYQLVDATIENYVQWKINADRVESEVAQLFFKDLTEVYRADLELTRQELENYLLEHPQPVRGDRPDIELLEIERLQSDLQLAGTRYSRALEKDENARLALSQAESDARQTYFLIDAPVMPEETATSLRDTAVNMIIFVVVGVILSFAGIVGSALLDRSFRFPVDVHNLVALPVLAAIPDTTPVVRWYQFGQRRKLRKQKEEREAERMVPRLVPRTNGVNGSHKEPQKAYKTAEQQD